MDLEQYEACKSPATCKEAKTQIDAVKSYDVIATTSWPDRSVSQMPAQGVDFSRSQLLDLRESWKTLLRVDGVCRLLSYSF